MEFYLKNLRLAMWEATELPERTWSDEKKEWQKTGKVIEQTNYIFRDEFGTKLTLLSREAKYRDYEGKDCDVQVRITQREFQGKRTTSLSLLDVRLAE